jgi:hypothetical protein
MAAFVLTVLIGNFFLPPDRAVTRQMLGHDFLAFYSAGTLARTGQFHSLYDLAAINALEKSAGAGANLTVGFGPWWNPPFAAWVFAPFSILPFSQALIAWEAVSLAALCASIVLLARMIPGSRDWRNWGLLALLIAVSSPAIAVVTHGQNSFITLLIVCVVTTLWRARRALVAGLVAGLLLYKPQHAAIVGIALIVTLGWRAAAGLMATSMALLVLTIITMPGALADYLHKLPAMLTLLQEQNQYPWDRHVTLKAFWRLLLQGDAAGPTLWTTTLIWYASETLIVIWLTRLARLARRDPQSFTDRFIAATLIAGPLLTPFCFDYDLVILAIPATLCAASRRNLAAWVVLYLSLYVSSLQARPSGFILVTPLMAALIWMLRINAETRRRRVKNESDIDPALLCVS